MSTTTIDITGMVRGVHHVGLPSARKDWDEIAAFWRTLGLRCETHEVERDDYDHAGAGTRLQVFAGTQLLVSYFAMPWLPFLLFRLCMRFMHVALDVFPAALDPLRVHPAFERETNWGYAFVSVFLTGSYGLHVECVTRDPSFHCDEL